MGTIHEREHFDKRNEMKSILAVLAAGIMWGCMGILVRSLNTIGMNSMEITAFRAFVTAVVMLLFMGIFKRKELKIRLKDIWCFFGTGILSVVFFNVCYFSAMSYTTLSVAAILLYTAPSFVMLMSFFLFKEMFTLRKVCALIAAFLGCVLVSGGFGSAGIGMKGLLCGLGAGFGYALYSIFSRYALQRGYSSYTITTYTFLFATIGVLPIIKVNHMVSCFVTNPVQFPVALFWAVFTTVAAYLLYTGGLKGLENGMASIIASIEPVVASMVGIFLYKEKLTTMGVCGMSMVLFACILLGLQKNEKN